MEERGVVFKSREQKIIGILSILFIAVANSCPDSENAVRNCDVLPVVCANVRRIVSYFTVFVLSHYWILSECFLATAPIVLYHVESVRGSED